MPAFKDESKRKKSECREERIEKRKRRRYTERERESDIVAQSVNENELPHHQPPHHHYYSMEQLFSII